MRKQAWIKRVRRKTYLNRQRLKWIKKAFISYILARLECLIMSYKQLWRGQCAVKMTVTKARIKTRRIGCFR